MKQQKISTKTVVLSALFAALICIATMIIKIPTPLKGYLNLGDGAVLLSAWILPPGFAFLAAGVGSALADIFSGYIVYAPITFLVKGAMTVTAYLIFKCFKKGNLFARIVSATAAEVVMVLGYFVFEGFMYGFIPSLANIPANAIQGAAGIVLSVLTITHLKKAISKFF